MSDLARITWDGVDGALVLNSDYEFRAEGGDEEALQGLLSLANVRAEAYTYNPADGQPGARLALEVAKALGGEAELPPTPPGQKGVVY
jgi:hypothetical protein